MNEKQIDYTNYYYNFAKLEKNIYRYSIHMNVYRDFCKIFIICGKLINKFCSVLY